MEVAALKNQKVLVLGLAKTGLSVVRHLQKAGALVTVNDLKDMDENKDAQTLVEEGVRVITGSHPVELLEEAFIFMVKNPGIPYENPMVQAALVKDIPVYTDIELAQWFNQGTLIGITGSNGKTTTTSLTAAILQASQQFNGSVDLAGNIGIPALEVIDGNRKQDIVVLELSSFQLLGTESFHPHIAAITNFTPTHLDYHHTQTAYLDAKWRLTQRQTKHDFLILNADDPVLWAKRGQTAAVVIPFSTKEAVKTGVWYDPKSDFIMWKEEAILTRSDLFLPGDHNLANALVAIAIACLMGVEKTAIQVACQNFKGVHHRLQYVGEIAGRYFYNDSKATNNQAAATALASFNSPTIWLCGGLDRGISPDPLKPSMTHVKGCIAMGQTKDDFIAMAQAADVEKMTTCTDMASAVEAAYAMSEEGDVILLSPACASWDQYLNFEVRGEAFIKAVKALKAREEGD